MEHTPLPTLAFNDPLWKFLVTNNKRDKMGIFAAHVVFAENSFKAIHLVRYMWPYTNKCFRDHNDARQIIFRYGCKHYHFERTLDPEGRDTNGWWKIGEVGKLQVLAFQAAKLAIIAGAWDRVVPDSAARALARI